MLTELLMARAALAHTELDMDSHAALQCSVGAWRRTLGEATDWLRLHLGTSGPRS